MVRVNLNYKIMNSCNCNPSDCVFESCKALGVCRIRSQGKNKSVKWRRKVRQKIFDRDGNKCLKCGTSENLTIDHIHPKSKGGTSKQSNLQTLCFNCNIKKGNKL